jgi:hypothetical protein
MTTTRKPRTAYTRKSASASVYSANGRKLSLGEDNVAKGTLRRHEWHEIHSITHRQMAERPAAGGRIQILDNSVRNAIPDLSPEHIAQHWGRSAAWLASAIKTCDMFQSAERIQHDSYEAMREQQLAAR